MVITFINEKGGVGKTALLFNAAYYLASIGRKVLMIDMDAQRANLTYMAGVDKDDKMLTIADVLAGVDVRRSVLALDDTLHIIPATGRLALQTPQRTNTGVLDGIKSNYDYIFVDVPPTPGVWQAVALSLSDGLIVPMLPDIMSLESIMGLAGSINAAQTSNPGLRVLGLVMNRSTLRTRLSASVHKTASKMASQLGCKVFANGIRNNVSIAEAVGQNVGVTEYAPKSNGAIDIINFCKELEETINA